MARILSGVQQANTLFGTCRLFPTSARNACCKTFQSSALDKCTQDVANSRGSDCNSRQLGSQCCASLTKQAKEQLTQFCAQAVAQVSNGCEVPETPTPEPTIPFEDPVLPVIVSPPSNSDAPSDTSIIPDQTSDSAPPGATHSEDQALPVASPPSNSDAPIEPSAIPDTTSDWMTPGATDEVSAL
jgi:hypothetical protein